MAVCCLEYEQIFSSCIRLYFPMAAVKTCYVLLLPEANATCDTNIIHMVVYGIAKIAFSSVGCLALWSCAWYGLFSTVQWWGWFLTPRCQEAVGHIKGNPSCWEAHGNMHGLPFDSVLWSLPGRMGRRKVGAFDLWFVSRGPQSSIAAAWGFCFEHLSEVVLGCAHRQLFNQQESFCRAPVRSNQPQPASK